MRPSLACPDWRDRIAAGRSLIPDLPLDEERSRRATGIFNKLRLPDVADQPTLAEAGGDWQREIVGALFGSFDREGNRFVREVFNLVPKKNNKTTGSAGIMMTALIANTRPRAEFLLIGPTHAVADTAFQQAVGMIAADRYLSNRFKPREHLKQIDDLTNGARLKIKTFDNKVLVGVKPVGVLIDELHELGKIPSAARVIGQIRGGILPFPEGFMVIITTQSDEPPAGVFKTELAKARAIRDGEAEGPLLPVLYEFPEAIMKSGDWRDPKNWWMVTPNRGRSITIERLVEDFATAQLAGDGEIRRWASQHLNLEIGIGLRSDRWPGAEFWERQTDRTLSLRAILERCEVIVVGVDGGGLDDLYGLSIIGREAGTLDWLSWSHAWAHESVLDRRKVIASRLRDHEAADELTIVDDELGDIAEIVEIIERVKSAGLLAAVVVDPAGLGELADALAEIDVTAENDLLVGAPQGFGLMNAIKTTERKLANGTFRHAASTMMDWCVSNLKIEPTATAIRATKQNAGDAKIDPAMALFDAVVVMSKNPEALGASVYDSEDAFV